MTGSWNCFAAVLEPELGGFATDPRHVKGFLSFRVLAARSTPTAGKSVASPLADLWPGFDGFFPSQHLHT